MTATTTLSSTFQISIPKGKDGKIAPVPVHGSKDIKKGTLSSIEKKTGVKLT